MNIQIFNYTVLLLQAILWQYNRATKTQFLLNKKNEWYQQNHEQFWMDWYDNVFNLTTANLFGLSVWSIILQIPMFTNLNPDPDGKPVFGFGADDGSDNGNQNFENGNFSNNSDSIVVLSIEEQRLVLRLRYYQLVSNGTIPSVNKFMKELFISYGSVYVLDGLKMFMVYVFNFPLSRRLLYIFQYFDLLVRPAGVYLKYRIIDGTVFGFGADDGSDNGNQNFENGNFLGE